ncbi:MAG: hypothetical protein J6C19_04215 [Lachnospiraceae bacterium]|nr:hypothetical protein [Lachnospiraceae bacterium]
MECCSLDADIKNMQYKNICKKGGAMLSVLNQLHHKTSAQKRMSSCSFDGMKASMTVEACFVLPFFLFAFLNMISIIELYRLQGNMSAAMHAAAKEMAVYGYEYQEIKGSPAGVAESLGLTYLYASNQVKRRLGTDYLDSSPIAGGASSISWLKSSVMQENDCIDLVAEYRIQPPAAIVGYHERFLYNRIRTRAWTGYDNTEGSGDNTGEEIVYITPEGKVYHKTRGCTYLKQSLSAVDMSFMETERNQNGQKYYPCEECGAACKDTVYISNYGNKMHSSLSCSKLKRTILAVPISQTEGRAPCSKCGR